MDKAQRHVDRGDSNVSTPHPTLLPGKGGREEQCISNVKTMNPLLKSLCLAAFFLHGVLYVQRNHRAYQGRGKSGMGNESPGSPPCSHSPEL